MQENLDGLIFAADIEKAFDSVDHKFVFASLEKYGFGPDFIQWIKTLLANNESCVMNNGSSTGFFKIQRGTKQGDPLSPYLFILVEILFIQIRNDKAVRGFKIGDIEIRLTAFIYLFIKIHKTFTKNVAHQYGCWVKCKFVKTIYIQKVKREKGIYNKWLKTLYSESTARNLSSFIHISILLVF